MTRTIAILVLVLTVGLLADTGFAQQATAPAAGAPTVTAPTTAPGAVAAPTTAPVTQPIVLKPAPAPAMVTPIAGELPVTASPEFHQPKDYLLPVPAPIYLPPVAVVPLPRGFAPLGLRARPMRDLPEVAAPPLAALPRPADDIRPLWSGWARDVSDYGEFALCRPERARTSAENDPVAPFAEEFVLKTAAALRTTAVGFVGFDLPVPFPHRGPMALHEPPADADQPAVVSPDLPPAPPPAGK